MVNDTLFDIEIDKIKKFNFPSDLLWKESTDAIKTSTKFQNFQNFHKNLIDKLPQNSIETRKRYAGIIIKRYFSDNGFHSLCPLVWKHYQDEKILQDIMRYQFMQKEDLMSRFLINYVLKNLDGKLTNDISKKFSIDIYGGINRKLIERLSIILKGMGYIYKDNKSHILYKPDMPKTAFLILLHRLLSQQPQTITVFDILNNPFWKYIRIYSQNDVREILKEANSKNILTKYVIADTLEQITTKYSSSELIERKIKL